MKNKIKNVSTKIESLSHGALILAVLALIVVANIAASAVTWRLDFSRGRAYSLSDSTKSIIGNIGKDPVKITLYASSTLPSQMQPVRRDVRDLLTEYDRAGNVEVVFVDPSTPQLEQQAQQAGIAPLQFSLTRRDKLEYAKGYFGMQIARRDKKEVIPQAIQLGDLEYQISSAIYRITTKELPTVGFMGADMIDPRQMQLLQTVLSKQFTVEAAATPEARIKSLVLFADGAKQFDSGEIALLDEYLKQGGSVVAMIDGVRVDPTLQVAPAEHSLFDWVRLYGITINKDLLLSQNAEFINAGGASQDNPFQVVVPYFFWLKTNIFDRNIGYFSNIQTLTFPWTSSVTTAGSARIITKTDPISWQQTKDWTLEPQSITEPKESDLKQFGLIAQASVNKKGTLTVIPTSRFVQAQFAPTSSGNINFVANVVSQSTSGGALSGIRQRDVAIVPLPPLAPNAQDFVKYSTILLLPALFGLFGFIRLYRRK